MPTFELTSPEGKKYRVSGPEGSTEKDALAQLQTKIGGGEQPAAGAASDPDAPMSWGDVGKGAVSNLGSSAMQFGHDIAQPFIHPVDTAKNLYKLGSGVGQKMGVVSGDENIPAADAVGQFFKNRYGGMENIKRTLSEDPVGVAGDAATLLSGGGGLAARVPGMAGKVGEVAAAAGRAVDPLTLPIAAASKGAKAASEVIGGLGTHTGGDAVRTAFSAGREGGDAGKAFQENMRGTAPMAETVDAARSALGQIRKERGEAYREGMKGVGADKTVLDFDKIDDALTNISTVKTYKGQSLSPKTQGIRQEIGEAIRDWKALDPAEFHTAEGLDALKQKVGDIRDATERGTPERLVADQAYQSIRKTIIAQAPEYAKTMKAYEEASTQIKEMEKTLSLNPNASVDTALRKLQSVLRDNVNTSFGRRKELAQYLVDAGAPNLMDRLAGQAMKPWMPRGLAKMVGTEMLALGAGAFGAGMTGGGAAMLGVAPFMSPRIVGEGSYYAGKTAGALDKVPGRALSKAAFQGGRIANQLNPREMIKEDAKAALMDKGRFTSSELQSIRQVARGKAPVEMIMRVKEMLERPNAQDRVSEGHAAFQ